MQIKEMLVGIPVLGFILWVFMAPLPQDRIARGCEPITWLGNLTTSATVLSSEKHAETAVRWSDKLNYSCQYMVWRLFYQDAYNKALDSGLVAPQGVLENPADEKGAAKDAPEPRAVTQPPVDPQKALKTKANPAAKDAAVEADVEEERR